MFLFNFISYSTYKQNCPARISVGLSKDRKSLKIKAANLNHSNHPTSKVFFDHIPETRRLSPESQQETMKLLAMGCNKKLVQTKLLEEKNKHVTLKDLSNIKAKLKNVNEESLPEPAKILETKYGATVKVLEEEKNFKGLFFVTETMKRSMSKWFHIVFIDGTYKLLKSGLTLMLLIVQDSNALSAVVGVALLASEDRPTFTWLLQSFKDVHAEACSKIQCFMSDKDLLERDVLKDVFPGTPVYICRFHTLRTFSRVITTAKLKISEEERNTSLKLLQQLVYSSSELVYDKLYRKFVESVPTSVADYFNDNWHSIREDWTTYSMVHGNLNNMTNNRLESMNAKIKQVVQKNSSLLQFIESFFRWLQSHNLEVKAKTANAFLKQPVEKFAPDSDRQKYQDILMPPSAKRVLEQIDLHKFVTNITCCDRTHNESIIRSNDVDLKVTPLSCECAIWTSEFVPCRHVFSVRRFFGLPLFSSELCQPRCTKQYVIQTEQSVETLQPADANKHQSTPSVSRVIPRKPATATEKRKKVTPIVTELLNLAVESCGPRFESRTSLLKAISKSWKEGCEVTIIRLDGSNSHEVVPADKNYLPEHQDLGIATEVNNNLSELLNEQCSFFDSDIVKPAGTSDSSPKLLETISANPCTPKTLTVSSKVNISEINMPPTIKTFGRPSRHLATSNGAVRRKHVAKRFADKCNEQKIYDMMGWLIDDSMIDIVIKGEYLICRDDLKLNDLKDSMVDKSVDLNLLAPYCETGVFALLKRAVNKKRKNNDLKCGRCEKSIVDNSVICDQCLLWHHFECVKLKRAPKTDTWFCQQCIRKK